MRIEVLMRYNIACLRLECYYRSFCHLKERPSIRKDWISNFQNFQKIPEREKLSHFKI